MTTASIRIVYRHPSERLAARLGRALVRWADERATVSSARQLIALQNQSELERRQREDAARQYLRG